jgi:hypothetical protein
VVGDKEKVEPELLDAPPSLREDRKGASGTSRTPNLSSGIDQYGIEGWREPKHR